MTLPTERQREIEMDKDLGDECPCCNMPMTPTQEKGVCIVHNEEVHSGCLHPEFVGLCIHCANIKQHSDTIKSLLETIEDLTWTIARLESQLKRKGE